MPARPTRLLDRPEAGGAADALSEVLRTVRLSAALFFRVEAAAPWCSTAPAGRVLAREIMPASEQVISYHVITAGSCWANLHDGGEVRLEVGDIVVFPHGNEYSLATRRGERGELDLDFFRQMAAGRLPFTIREGSKRTPDLQLLCGFLGCDLQPYNPLLATLPRVLVVRRSDAAEGERLARIIELARAEAANVLPGSACVLARLSELLFIEAVRQHLRDASPEQTGWLSGLRDDVVGRALSALHQDPGAPLDAGTPGARSRSVALGPRQPFHGFRRGAADAVPHALAHAEGGARAR